jgi:hypothetical protein
MPASSAGLGLQGQRYARSTACRHSNTARVTARSASPPSRLAHEPYHHDQPLLISYEAAWRAGSRAHAELARLVDALA